MENLGKSLLLIGRGAVWTYKRASQPYRPQPGEHLPKSHCEKWWVERQKSLRSVQGSWWLKGSFHSQPSLSACQPLVKCWVSVYKYSQTTEKCPDLSRVKGSFCCGATCLRKIWFPQWLNLSFARRWDGHVISRHFWKRARRGKSCPGEENKKKPEPGVQRAPRLICSDSLTGLWVKTRPTCVL